jgi:hypothetical protein
MKKTRSATLATLVLGQFVCVIPALGAFDYKYSVTRFLDADTSEIVTRYDNYYETDNNGDPLYQYSLPIYVGRDPDINEPNWLDPGFFVEVRAPQGGGAPAIGAPAPRPGGGGRHMPFHHTVNKHDKVGRITVVTPGVQMRRSADKNNPAGPWGAVAVGQNFGNGCFEFRGPLNSQVKYTQCDVTLTPLPDQDLADIYVLLGVEYWPDPSAPTFYSNKGWDMVYIGSFGAGGPAGFGQVLIECNNDAFVSGATPEAYTGCVPEPASLCLALSALTGFMLIRRLRRADGWPH